MLKYIIAIIVIVLAWAVCFVIPLPWTVAIAVTGLVFLVLLGIFLYRRYRALKAAREIEKALNAQADEQARAARPEQQAEVRAMQAEVNRAITALKNSKLGGKGGAEALYALPWYVIVGPPGSGKTTALRNSGIPFPYMSAQTGGGIRGVGGTRNCEWWLSNEGVLLDTAGRYMTEDDDREEWLSFLDLVKKNRPLKPLNGIIVAVNVAELGASREQQVEATARRVRERVDEVQARLQLTLPIYVLFTKCDLVQGFTEFFDDLRKSERGQIWGFTVPLARTEAAPSALFGERFEEMTRTVEMRSLKRIAQEPVLAKREAVYQFPQQFASLKQNLGDFLDALFASNVYQAAPLLRGVYFTSGTQEGRPIDQLAEKLRASFGLPAAPAPASPPPQEQKSYFLRDVFARVIFPDQHIAALSAEERKRLDRRKYYFAAGAFGLAALLSIIPANAYMENRALVRRADDAVTLIAPRLTPQGEGQMQLAELQRLRNVVFELKGYEDGHPPVAMTFGMYQGAELYPKMSQLFTRAMRTVVQQLTAADLRDMQAFVQRTGDRVAPADERSEYYNRLKLHLVLSQPKQSNEPALEGEVATFTTNQLANEWIARTTQSVVLDDRSRAAMQQNMALFTALLARDPRLLIARQQPVVSTTRAVLNRTSSIDIALNDIITSVDSAYDMTLLRAINRSPDYMTQRGAPETHRVRGAFTRYGWENFVRERLNRTPETIAGDAWVLGQAPTTVDRQRQVLETLVQLRSDYFRAYIAEWRAFLGSIYVRDPADAGRALVMLQWFTQGGTPVYEHLMRTVAENTNLPDPDSASSNAAGRSLMRSIEREINNRLNRTRTGQAINQATRAGVGARQGGDGTSTFVHLEDVARDPLLYGLVEFGVPPTPPTPAQQPGQAAPPPPPPPGPTALREYQEQLAFVRDALQTYQDNPRSASQPLLQKVSEAQTRVAALINNARVDSRPVLTNLLPPPIQFTAQRTLGALGGASNDRWCAAVWTPFQRTLFDHYPYNPNGSDAAIADLAQFYDTNQGSLWTFYNEVLANDIPRSGGEFDFTQRLAESTGSVYRPELVEFLARSQDITTVLFPPPSQRVPPAAGAQGGGAGSGPAVDFEVRVRPTPTIAETTFTVDGEELRYTNGPEEWHRFHWPGNGNQRGAKIRARGLNGVDETIEQDGEWGVYRLFELGQVRGSANGRIFSVTWHLRDQNLTVGVDVRPARSENPFFGLPRRESGSDRYLSPFRANNVIAPSPIARNSRACSAAGLPRSASPRRRHRRSAE